MKSAVSRLTLRPLALAVVLLLLLGSWGLFHTYLQRGWTSWLVLRSENPNSDLFIEGVRNCKDPVEFLQSCWATGKVVHRHLVASYLKESAAAHLPWIGRAESLALATTIDADASVRELGLAALDQLHSPHLFDAAALQLKDLDPMVRRFGLDYLRKSDPGLAVPLLVQALDDPDLGNVTTAENALMRFSGQDFGVRASLAIQDSADDEHTNSAKTETIHRGVEKRKQWWAEHRQDYPATVSRLKATKHSAFADSSRPTAPDFQLRDLEGKKINLSDLKGKVVLVNFWATWCTACLKEIPDLVALQQKMGDQIAVIGVSLDGVPDEDGDIPGEEDQTHKKGTLSPKSVRAKVERAVKLRRINYPVLLDPKGVVGGQYNGGELPTTIIFDAQGRVRRRFIGERSVTVFEAMIREAEQSNSGSAVTR